MASIGGAVKSVVNGLVSILPRVRGNPAGVSLPNTFNPSAAGQDLALPGYRDHLSDIFSDRSASDSRALIQQLFRTDPDVSAAVNAYLTVADVPMWYVVKDSNGVISRPGHKALEQLMLSLGVRFDYTKPSNFYLQKSMHAICEELRYMVLLRGGIGSELVLSKLGLPQELRPVDLATITWQEKAPSVYVPIQLPKNSSDRVSMDIPTFFVAFHRQDPTTIYPYSPFISAINTIASRQQVINDLYRIMQMNGYPRIDVKLVEETLRKNAPATAQADPKLMMQYMAARRTEIEGVIANLQANQALVHFDSAEVDIVGGSGKSAMTMDITPIIEVLNAQNQAGLKTMATVIGRGTAGVNTASVEARIFTLNAQALNKPISDLLSQVFTFALRLQGIDAVVEIGFENVEMRPDLELESQLTQKQTRYLQLLSLGLIDDDEWHLEMFNRIRPDPAPLLSGTHFMDTIAADGAQSTGVPGEGGNSAANPQPNSLDRQATPKDSKKTTGGAK